MKKGPLMIVRLLACLGLLISLWLLVQKATGRIDSIVGCGGGSDCANVLGSRWSQVFFLPVSAFSSLLYAGLIFLSFRPRAMPLFIVALLLIGAAIWFTGLQALVLKTFCPWCLGTHSVGMICGVMILWGLERRPAKPGLPMILAGLLLGILILGQTFGPRPSSFLLSEETLAGEASEAQHEKSPGRRVEFFGGQKSYVLDELPHLGPLDAPHVCVEYFDYLCGSCRDMSGDLKALQSAHPGKICVILLPCPLNRACNPNMTSAMDDHAGACEVARLALAAWRARPASFEAIHSEIFSAFPASPSTVREIIARHAPEMDLEAALDDPWIAAQLDANCADFGQLVSSSPKMPKLLIKDRTVMHGLSSSAEEFVKVVGETLGLGDD